jgi:hypothetical protein
MCGHCGDDGGDRTGSSGGLAGSSGSMQPVWFGRRARHVTGGRAGTARRAQGGVSNISRSACRMGCLCRTFREELLARYSFFLFD